jgi:hypothetical protein
MKPRKKKMTDDEIEAEVLMTRNDPDAWEALPFVPPSQSPRPAWMLQNRHLELAAKFHVLSVLHRFGAEANLSLTQPDNVDITMLGRGGQTVTIDVKTLHETQSWVVGQFSARKHHYLVFVEFVSADIDPASAPRAYVVASEDLRRFLSRRKLAEVSVTLLSDELSAREAWQLIVAERAA